MKKGWKIFWFILLGIFVLVLLFIGLVAYNGYKYYNFYNTAEDLRPFIFGSSQFNEKLSTCSPSYSNGWEIRGLDKGKCTLIFNWNSTVDYDNGLVSYDKIACELPPDIYDYPTKIDWSSYILDKSSCKS